MEARPAKIRRLAFTNKQRQELRRYHAEHPELRSGALQEWFQNQYGRPIGQSSVSDILSSRYDHLDGVLFTLGAQDARRAKTAAHPVLEDALFQVYQRLVQEQQPITSTVLKAAAHRLWEEIPAFRGIPEPAWSNGWLDGFQRRRGIPKRRQQQGGLAHDAEAEPDAAPDQVQLQSDLVRSELQPHEGPRDTYTLHEAALFWKLTPDRSLNTDRLSGRKREKARITTIHCWNADGSHILPLWVVGKAASPPSFGADLQNLKPLDVTYRANAMAWITGPLISEWLLCFAQATRGRNVVLSLDNHSAHEAAVAQLAQRPELAHIRIMFLPPETSSGLQTADHGLINAFKAAYRRRSLEHMLDQAQMGESATIDPFRAVRWAATAWSCIAPSFIAGLWQSPAMLGPAYVVQPSNYGYEARLAQKLVELKVIRQTVGIELFMSPPDEVVEDPSASDPIQYVLDQYQAEKDDVRDEESLPAPSIMSADDASRAIERLLHYEEQQESVDAELMRQLEQCQHLMLTRRLQRAVEGERDEISVSA